MTVAQHSAKFDAIRFVLENLRHYDKVTVVSYTPSLFLGPERNSRDEKRKLSDELKARMRGGNKETVIYVSASGLEQLPNWPGISREELEKEKSLWSELGRFQEANPDKVKIFVVEDDNLPSVSIVLGQRPPDRWSMAHYDLLVEYRIGITRKLLFALGTPEGKSAEWEPRQDLQNLPAFVTKILEALPENTTQRFVDWVNNLGEALPSPSMAILSAMSTEVGFYRSGLIEDRKELPLGFSQGRINLSGKWQEVLLPPTSYARSRSSHIVTSVSNDYKSVGTFVFAGIAGGCGNDLKLGDVVVSEDVMDLRYERYFTVNNLPSSPGKPNSEIVHLGSNKWVEMRVEEYSSKYYEKSIQGFLDKLESNKDWWRAIVTKYLTRCEPSPERDDLLKEPPRVRNYKIWSSDHNVNDSILRDELAEKFNVRAFEMEGGGFANAALACGRNFLLVRGISDLADGDRLRDKVYQPLAIATTSACLEALLPLIVKSR